MMKRVNLSQFRSKLRQIEAKQRQAISQYNQKVRQYNQTVRNLQAAIDRYNREVRTYNSRQRQHRQRVQTELARLRSHPSRLSSTNIQFRTSVTSLHESYARLEQSAAARSLSSTENYFLDLSEREMANSLGVLNALEAETPSTETTDLQQTTVTAEIAIISEELDERWRGALFALHPQNPGSSRNCVGGLWAIKPFEAAPPLASRGLTRSAE